MLFRSGFHFAGRNERDYFIIVLTRIADPVLDALSRDELKKSMPVEVWGGSRKLRENFACLEAFGRLLSGMAPWLELGPDESPEGKIRGKYINLALKCIHNATDNNAPDYMNFCRGTQPLVDAAFLAQALIRAPVQLWGRLDDSVRNNVIRELKSTRRITPWNNNWLFFSAMVEAAIL